MWGARTLLVALVFGVGASEYPAAQAATAKGELRDKYTGDPIPGRRLRLGRLNSIATTTDSEGRFEVARPPQPSLLDLMRGGVEGEQLAREGLYDGSSVYNSDGTPTTIQPGSESVDLGVVWGDGGFVQRFAPVCDGRRVAEEPRKSVLTFFRTDEKSWVHSDSFAYGFNLGTNLPKKVVLCAKIDYYKVGTYSGVGSGMRAVAQVTAYRLSDMKKFKKTFVAEPESQIRGPIGSGSTGDPAPAIRDWLRLAVTR